MIRLAAAVLVVLASPTLAHGGHDHDPGPGWTFDPLVTVPLGLLLLLFLVGSWRLSRRSNAGRRRSWLFLGGWLVLALSLVSPLHEGGEASFTLHMVEHELIMLLATLLIAASHAGGVLAWGFPAAIRRGLARSWRAPLARLWRHLTAPVAATLLQAMVMWVWHAPALFDRTLTSQSWHIAQHLSFVLASLIFWTAMLDSRRGTYLLSAACLFATSLIEGALGALMALSASPWYAAYASMDLSGIGLDPTTDQQLAGLIMWVPGGLVHGGAALALLHAWLKASDGSRAVPAE
jgi:putative membrane protein